MSRSSAIKFLMARKFHVDRALELYQQHELMRLREDLSHVEPSESPIREELLSEKFTILPVRDVNGATLALFNAHKHDPSQTDHRSTLQGVVYQLDVALENLATQRGGLVFIYNMSGSKYANFDYDLSQKMLTLLKGAYPARLKKVLIVTAPFWFKAPFKVLRLFVREKLRDRVFTVSLPQLQTHIPPQAIPSHMGGQLVHDHEAWLSDCLAISQSRDGQLVTINSSSQPSTPHDHRKRHPTLEQLQSMPLTLTSGAKDNSLNLSDTNSAAMNGLSKLIIPSVPHPEDEALTHNVVNGNGHHHSITHSDMTVSNCSSGGLSEDEENDRMAAAGMTLSEFIEHVRIKGRRGLYDEYGEIKNRPPMGTFNHARAFENQEKNRYTDVLCYDHSRVQLQDGESDYINANFVDGYEQPRAFISSQGPLPKTFPDFWRMVWEQHVLVIVMTTKTTERNRTKCGQYWPEDVGSSLKAKPFEIHSEEIENCEDFYVTHLTLKNLETGEIRPVCHFQFVSWPDYGVPESALSMIIFLERVREKQASMLSDLSNEWQGHLLGPPIVVHCSAGIGRTGTFATLDIAIRKFEDIQKIDIRSTVEHIRAQRAFSIQMPDQYVFCHLAFLEYVVHKDYVEEIDWTGFNDDCDSE
ncbi:hypothetical protein TCAL_11593 [Tigriopus californicus]|uniref:Tyrosine-protein phosphatase non-receptor type 9 n=2 Tax=Tigriopus californicus TaxID=6832 RepID=A0A553PLW3_TIGCA|nr:hypothetical protein TCAL_11593 [Tigriopus californicus]|eukprot:TCALIF_11593-PA protein Name:"Similar to Ptpn9 Tyrosine-protein phosphatase non-receptor type 9 (Mus musculus)" AED:0.02 eAED:0.03 QI:0/-1/0/1/-1/1/1/0/639